MRVEGWVVANDASDNGPRLRLLVRSIEGVAEPPRYVRVSVSEAGLLTRRPRRDAAAPCSARRPGPMAPGAYDFARRAYFERLGATGFAFGRCRPADFEPPPDLARPPTSDARRHARRSLRRDRRSRARARRRHRRGARHRRPQLHRRRRPTQRSATPGSAICSRCPAFTWASSAAWCSRRCALDALADRADRAALSGEEDRRRRRAARARGVSHRLRLKRARAALVRDGLRRLRRDPARPARHLHARPRARGVHRRADLPGIRARARLPDVVRRDHGAGRAVRNAEARAARTRAADAGPADRRTASDDARHRRRAADLVRRRSRDRSVRDLPLPALLALRAAGQPDRRADHVVPGRAGGRCSPLCSRRSAWPIPRSK